MTGSEMTAELISQWMRDKDMQEHLYRFHTGTEGSPMRYKIKKEATWGTWQVLQGYPDNGVTVWAVVNVFSQWRHAIDWCFATGPV